MVTQDRVKEAFSYNPVTGVFRNRVQRRSAKVGDVPGSIGPEGYWRISLDGKVYQGHRLVFLYLHGYMPEEIDHINGVRYDNRAENLRAVSHSENMRNCVVREDSTTGVRGVSPNRGGFLVSIYSKGKKIAVGWFKNINDAKKARMRAEVEYGYGPRRRQS